MKTDTLDLLVRAIVILFEPLSFVTVVLVVLKLTGVVAYHWLWILSPTLSAIIPVSVVVFLWFVSNAYVWAVERRRRGF